MERIEENIYNNIVSFLNSIIIIRLYQTNIILLNYQKH